MRRLLPTLLVCFALSAGCAARSPAPRAVTSSPSSKTASSTDTPAGSAGGAVANISLRDDRGRWVRLGDLIGQQRVVLVTFWATWCAPCMTELSRLADMQRRRGAEGLRVVAVNTDPPASQGRARSVVRRVDRGGQLLVLMDQESILMRELNPRATLPYYVLFDRGGALVHSHQGYQPGDERAIEARVGRLLGKQ